MTQRAARPGMWATRLQKRRTEQFVILSLKSSAHSFDDANDPMKAQPEGFGNQVLTFCWVLA